MRAAGSTSKSPTALASQAGRFEARPEVQAGLAEARLAVSATTARAWRTGIGWIDRVVAETPTAAGGSRFA